MPSKDKAPNSPGKKSSRRDSSKRNKSSDKSSKMRKSRSSSSDSSPRGHEAQLLAMLEEECHNSFLKLPDEQPLHIWNTDEAEAHVSSMKKLDKKLNKANDDIVKLKELLLQADEKSELDVDRCEERETHARQEIVDLEEAERQVEQDAFTSTLQFGQLKVKLETNTQKIGELRNESKKLTKELRKQEKQLDKISFNNIRLEESSGNLLNSYSDLTSSKVFDESNLLLETVEEGREQHELYTEAVNAMQERYLNEARQRLELQKSMADMLTIIQTAAAQENLSCKLSNACTEVGLDCEARWTQMMADLEAAEGE